VLKKDVPYGKIIVSLLTTQPLEVVPRFPVPIPGIVVLTAGSIFPAVFDYDFLEIVHEDVHVISDEGVQGARFQRNKGMSRMLFVVWVVAVASFWILSCCIWRFAGMLIDTYFDLKH
jgi:hypothetical protein